MNIWAAIDPNDNIYIYDELEANGTVPEISKLILTKEKMERSPQLRIMDPNKAKAPAKVGGKGSLLTEFGKERLHFYININDNIQQGHLAVKKYLSYNKAKPIGVGNRPKLYFFKSCKRAIKGMTHYIWDEYRNKDMKSPKEKPKDLYKDFPDCVRYLIMSNPHYSRPEFHRTKERPNSLTGY